MSDDTQLLRQFAVEGSETAFRQLVDRHISLVYGTARRVLAGDTALAEDVTQTVFCDLAGKAASLSAVMALGGWLYQHTCYTAAKAMRSEQRRRARERIAVEIHVQNDDPCRDTHWQQLAPVIDDALSHLSAADRDAIVLRYFQSCEVRGIGAAQGITENAAQKRLGRALEKLRGFLTKRGLTLSTALLATTLDSSAALSVPPGLAAHVSAVALSSAGAATGFSLTTLKQMLTSKINLAAAATFAVAGFAAYVWPQPSTNATALPPAHISSAAAAPAALAALSPASKTMSPRVAAPAAPAVDTGTETLATPPAATTEMSNVAAEGEFDVTTNGVVVLENISTDGSVDVSSGQTLQVVADGTTTLTTTENGVSHMQMIAIPASGTFTTTSPGGGATIVVGGVGASPRAFTTGTVVAGGMGGTFTYSTAGGATAGGSAGSSSISSKSVKNPDGTITVTTNKDGVITTETLPAGSSPSPFPNAMPAGPGQVVTFKLSDQTP